MGSVVYIFAEIAVRLLRELGCMFKLFLTTNLDFISAFPCMNNLEKKLLAQSEACKPKLDCHMVQFGVPDFSSGEKT